MSDYDSSPAIQKTTEFYDKMDALTITHHCRTKQYRETIRKGPTWSGSGKWPGTQ